MAFSPFSQLDWLQSLGSMSDFLEDVPFYNYRTYKMNIDPAVKAPLYHFECARPQA